MVNPTKNNVIKATKEVRKHFNELRNNFSREETKKIREKFQKKEVVYILKAKEQKDALTKNMNKCYKILESILKISKKILKNYKNIGIILHIT